jgi:hypothetical protein
MMLLLALMLGASPVADDAPPRTRVAYVTSELGNDPLVRQSISDGFKVELVDWRIVSWYERYLRDHPKAVGCVTTRGFGGCAFGDPQSESDLTCRETGFPLVIYTQQYDLYTVWLLGTRSQPPLGYRHLWIGVFACDRHAFAATASASIPINSYGTADAALLTYHPAVTTLLGSLLSQPLPPAL